MFWKIFLFEVQNRLRRPAVYLYFLAALIFTVFSFSTGSLPVQEKEHINSPYLIAFWCSAITMIMMLISSSIMGTALYRDIEYNTKDYYLTYPITKAGYFLGRCLGSFLFMVIIGTAILFGIFIGSKLGPVFGITDIKQYGPNHLLYYLYPFFTIALPNLFFTSALFFSLVALTRNVKVIYAGGILLFLGYFLSIFFLDHTNNATLITLADPFVINAVRFQTSNSSSVQQNTTLIAMVGPLLINRLIWVTIGFVFLIYTYIQFDFENFFSGRIDKSAITTQVAHKRSQILAKANINFKGRYNRSTLASLTKVELLNIVRDNYFWIILFSGIVFLGFAFWMGSNYNGVPDFPRTVTLMDIFSDAFPFFIFFIIIFYTGETLHRDRLTRYSFINDSLPPPNWILNGSKLAALLVMGFGLALIPFFTGIVIQIAKGYYQFNLPFYLSFVFAVLLPRLLEMVVFAYTIHVIINNKFVAHGIGVTIWTGVFFLRATGIFNYNLLLYSYTPWYGVSDMDGFGPMVTAIFWFNFYWVLVACLLVIVSALFYYRGVTSSIKERWQLVPERFDKITRILTAVVVIFVAVIGGYIYYNVSYLNNFTTSAEDENRAIIYEKSLKHFDSLPLPKITRIKMFAELFPDKQQQKVHAFLTIVNKNSRPIKQLLLDGDELTEYSITSNGKPMLFITPLIYHRAFFSFFRSRNDTAAYRLYTFEKPLLPGDSVLLQVNSLVAFKGFSNGMYGTKLIRNGTFFTGGLPGLGYDDDDEVSSPYVRKKNHLPPKEEEEIAQNDPKGISTLKAGAAIDLLEWDLTISTSGDQSVVSCGTLEKQWRQNGRNYYHFVQNKPGMYVPLAAVSAKYAVTRDSINIGNKLNIAVYYHPEHITNVSRFIGAYKDGLQYFTNAFGHYPFTDIRLAETSVYSPRQGSFTSFDTFPEYFGWNANFTDPNQTDYLYFTTAQLLSQQWWRFQVAPNSTLGSLVIPEGLARYSALMMMERKYGKNNMRWLLQDQLWPYLAVRRRMEEKEQPLISANTWFEWEGKAAVALYGLKDLMGEDSLNSALCDFRRAYEFKDKPPFAGTNDLYHYLQKHTPDSLQYFLTDTWQKITLYDNKITGFKVAPTSNGKQYRVTLTFNVAKVYINNKGDDVAAKQMNDYIDVGIFAADTNNKEGRSTVNPLYLKKLKLSYGVHTITVVVNGKPVRAGIDPYNKLIDRIPNDNTKDL